MGEFSIIECEFNEFKLILKKKKLGDLLRGKGGGKKSRRVGTTTDVLDIDRYLEFATSVSVPNDDSLLPYFICALKVFCL